MEEIKKDDNETLASEIIIPKEEKHQIWEKVKRKIIDDFTSRKFLILAIAVIAFFVTKSFNATHLIYAFGIYGLGNAVDKITGSLSNGLGKSNSSNPPATIP